jgi:molybdopterin molybdotransferase
LGLFHDRQGPYAKAKVNAMSSRLTPIADALNPVLGRVRPVRPQAMAPRDALGMILGAPVQSPGPVPLRPIALREGFAINAADVVGASAYSPVRLRDGPIQVAISEPLPDGCNAIVPFDAAVKRGCFVEIAESAAPGEGVRLTGHDLSLGFLIADRGALVTPTLQLVLACAGIETVEISSPTVCIAPGAAAGTDWLAAQLITRGCRLAGDRGRDEAHLVINWAIEDRPILACNPGQTGFIRTTSGAQIEIVMPQRFDGLVAIFVLLVLPVVAALAGRAQPMAARPLSGKVTSTVGLSEVVLLKSVDGGCLPLCVGEITLSALAAADAFAIVPPESEGLAKGALVWAIPFNGTVYEK